MKYFISTLLIILSYTIALSQVAVEGSITNTENQPILGATVTYTNEDSGLRDGTISDGEGNFRFKLKETGSYIISISYVGMYTVSFP